ncbi:energy transducer TonB [Pontibacter russatus]|uniref:energy transducer TonB n=1 Tax=Pontibacter russatus TaxID=2694929 RepID=UPI00137A4114|nr:energy transducer TonB [Pontibacter russatus]
MHNTILLKLLQLIPVFSLLLAVSFAVSAQEADSIWYDKKWKETTSPEERFYLRTISTVAGANSFEVTDHYPDGSVQMKGYFSSIKPEVRQGEFHYFSETGVLTLKNIWVNNIVAETFSYDTTGKQTQHIIKREYLATLSPEEKFEKYGIKEIDKHPEFPGGQDSFLAFLSENMVYPSKAVQEKIEGRVIIAVTINKRGKLEEARILQSAHPLLDEEALRVAKTLPKKGWAPAQDKGGNISADFTFPVLFKL